MIDWSGLFEAIGFVVFVLICSIALIAAIKRMFGRYL